MRPLIRALSGLVRPPPPSGSSHLRADSIFISDTSDLHRALRDVGFVRDGLSVPRLYCSRDEADGIFSVIPAETGLKVMDFKASRYTVMNSDLTQFRIIHFATHGILSNEHPELSGLVLSLVDEHGRPQDGFLRLHDIYQAQFTG